MHGKEHNEKEPPNEWKSSKQSFEGKGTYRKVLVFDGNIKKYKT